MVATMSEKSKKYRGKNKENIKKLKAYLAKIKLQESGNTSRDK